MELVYFYKEELDKDVSKILNLKSFSNINYTIMESDIINIKKSKGYFLYIKGTENINILNKKLENIGVERLYNSDADAIKGIFKFV